MLLSIAILVALAISMIHLVQQNVQSVHNITTLLVERNPENLHLPLVNHSLDHHPVADFAIAEAKMSGSGEPESEDQNPLFFGICHDEPCIFRQGAQLARVFSPRPLRTWHVPATQRARNPLSIHSWQGLLLVKVPKAASSTMAGVVLRIGRNHQCTVSYHHIEGYNFYRRSHQSFLLGSVRQPAARALSAVYFFAKQPWNLTNDVPSLVDHLRHGWKATDGRGHGGAQYSYMALTKLKGKSVFDRHNNNHSIPTLQLPVSDLMNNVAQLVLNQYDFIVVTERMDESLVALSMLMGLPISDVMVAANSKVSGNYVLSRWGPDKGNCVALPSAKVETAAAPVQSFLSSPEWYMMNYADYLLYAAANASLDRTIDTLGRDPFQRRLAEYRTLRQRVLDYCGLRLGSGCYANGTKVRPVEVCYDRDFGCGYQCVNEALKQERRVSEEGDYQRRLDVFKRKT